MLAKDPKEILRAVPSESRFFIMNGDRLAIGNDIIDLASAKVHHRRFPKRVLSSSELVIFNSHHDPESFLWKAWAAKEAFYKFLNQIDKTTIFQPSQYVFDEKAANISFQNTAVHVVFEITNLYIHALVATSHHDPLVKIGSKENILDLYKINKEYLCDGEKMDIYSDESLAVRLLTKSIFSEILSCAPADLQIRSDLLRRPRIYFKKAPLNLSLSFSHHGRFVGMASSCADRIFCRNIPV